MKTGVGTVCALLLATPAMGASLVSPLPSITHGGGNVAGGAHCRSVPPPVVTLGGVSYYLDARHSIADPALRASNEDMQRPVLTFVDGVTSMSDAWRRAGDASSAVCAAIWLDSWAQADALRETQNAAGGYRRSWYLGGLATVWLKIRDASGIDTDRRLRITRWLASQALRIVDFYKAPERQRDALNNHGDWAALAVALAAIGAQDAPLFAWADARYRANLAQITQSGALPLEMARGRRALHYHLFALTPMLLMAGIEQVNGRPYDADAMARLEQFTRAALEHPSRIEQLTGVVQDMPGRKGDPSELVWGVVSPTRPGMRLSALLAARSPVVDRRVGGDVRLNWVPSGRAAVR